VTSTAATRFEHALKERLRGDADIAKLATVLGITHDTLLDLMAQVAIDPDATPRTDLVSRSSKKPLVTGPELIGYLKKAVEAARAADPSLFADVRKAALAQTQPGDPRTADPALKAELQKLLKRGAR
jgi:hypothetical protein